MAGNASDPVAQAVVLDIACCFHQSSYPSLNKDPKETLTSTQLTCFLDPVGFYTKTTKESIARQDAIHQRYSLGSKGKTSPILSGVADDILHGGAGNERAS